MKQYEATVTTTVMMDAKQYKEHLINRKEMYTRLIKDQDEKFARAKERWSRQVDEYEAKINAIETEIKAL